MSRNESHSTGNRKMKETQLHTVDFRGDSSDKPAVIEDQKKVRPENHLLRRDFSSSSRIQLSLYAVAFAAMSSLTACNDSPGRLTEQRPLQDASSAVPAPERAALTRLASGIALAL